ncbi:MAG: tetratricopeptide repeat protein [Vicinamibacteria bacterium]|nr:tetratricopeptide repeat protein [Vicinamibacteria bacterium]
MREAGKARVGVVRDERPFWPAAAALFAVALSLRLWHAAALEASPFGTVLLGDAAVYDAWARRIAVGDWLGQGVFYQAPLYPYLLGVLYRFVGDDLATVRIAQAFVGALAAVVAALAARELFGRKAGLAAGALLAFHAPSIFFDGLLQKASLDVLLAACVLWFVALLLARPTGLRALASGAVLAGLILTRENALLWAPLLLIWLALRPVDRRTTLPAFLLGLGLVLGPVAARNYAFGGGMYLTTSQLGANLYIGNHEGATGTYTPLRKGRGNAALEQQDAALLARAALGRELGPGEVSSYWTRQALAWATAHPGDWLELSFRKLALLWNTVESPDTEDLYSHAEWSLPLRIADAALPFGILAPLGLFGLWITRARLLELWIFHALMVTYILSLMAFYVVARYRLPLAPMLAVFGAAGLTQSRRWWRDASAVERLRGGAVLALALLFCNWPMQSIPAMKALTRFNLGEALRSAGRSDEAIEQFQASLALDPNQSAAASNLGALLAERGDHDGALPQFEAAIAADPGNAAARNNLGQEFARRGRMDEAMLEFRRSIDLDPEDSAPHQSLGIALASVGRADQAIVEFEEAIRLEPEDAVSHNNLGILLASAGRVEDGIGHFRKALAAKPGFEEAAANLAKAEEILRERK